MATYSSDKPEVAMMVPMKGLRPASNCWRDTVLCYDNGLRQWELVAFRRVFAWDHKWDHCSKDQIWCYAMMGSTKQFPSFSVSSRMRVCYSSWKSWVTWDGQSLPNWLHLVCIKLNRLQVLNDLTHRCSHVWPLRSRGIIALWNLSSQWTVAESHFGISDLEQGPWVTFLKGPMGLNVLRLLWFWRCHPMSICEQWLLSCGSCHLIGQIQSHSSLYTARD